jgi:hypothetical protein
MKKIQVLIASLFLFIILVSAQESNYQSEKTPVCYTFVINSVPDGYNIPLIGISNYAQGNHNTIEIGFANTNELNLTGIQAGFFNTVGGILYGMQYGFINSTAKTTNGIQAGFINSSKGETNGLQVGFINSSKMKLSGFQSGFINSTSGNLNGFQDGFINSVSGKTLGAQIGFINSTKKLSGLQIGFINSVDTLENGLPIGFLSFVKKGGIRQIEISYSDLYPINIAYKTGVRQFYTFPMISFNPGLSEKMAVGFGIGTNLDLSRNFFINPELVSQQSVSMHFNQYNSLKIGFGFKVTNGFELVAGPSMTWHWQGGNIDYDWHNWRFDSYYYNVNDLRIGLNLAARFNL